MNFKQEFNGQFEKQKSILIKVREGISKTLSAGNGIDKLIDKKVEEYILMEEQPLPIRIGDRTVFVGNFTWENEERFWTEWGSIIALLQTRVMNMDIAETRRKDLLERGGFDLLAKSECLLEFLYLDRKIFKQLAKLLKKTLLKQQSYYRSESGHRDKKAKWKNCSWRYFRKNVTKEKLIQICWLIYFFNFDAEKKNLSVIINRLNLRSLEQTYMYSWLRNLDGMTGKFVAAQAPSIDSVFADSPSSETPQKKQRKNPGLDKIEVPDGNIPKDKEQADEKPDRETPAQASQRTRPAEEPR